MTKTQWDLLKAIYDNNKNGIKPSAFRCNKKVLDACKRNYWVEEIDGYVSITELGEKEAREKADFDDFEPTIYQTKY